jgi:hypothetical protein
VNENLVRKGLATIIRHREGEATSSVYDRLLIASDE